MRYTSPHAAHTHIANVDMCGIDGDMDDEWMRNGWK
jgi:hypothetical protein